MALGPDTRASSLSFAAPGVGVAGFFCLAAVIYSITLLREGDVWRWVLLVAGALIGIATVSLELKHIDLQRLRNPAEPQQPAHTQQSAGDRGREAARMFFKIMRDWWLVVLGGLFAVVVERTFPLIRETGGPPAFALYALIILVSLIIGEVAIWYAEKFLTIRLLHARQRTN